MCARRSSLTTEYFPLVDLVQRIVSQIVFIVAFSVVFSLDKNDSNLPRPSALLHIFNSGIPRVGKHSSARVHGYCLVPVFVFFVDLLFDFLLLHHQLFPLILNSITPPLPRLEPLLLNLSRSARPVLRLNAAFRPHSTTRPSQFFCPLPGGFGSQLCPAATLLILLICFLFCVFFHYSALSLACNSFGTFHLRGFSPARPHPTIIPHPTSSRPPFLVLVLLQPPPSLLSQGKIPKSINSRPSWLVSFAASMTGS